ncbi:nucleotidyl transferase AbiEii/AbiGii toxin family protein [Desulfoplanes sp.]
MNLFEKLVTQALRDNKDMAVLQPVVEKEILHHDILREMSSAGLLERLTFIGGTCLRACYGSRRLSEDLDFTGGADLTKTDLVHLGKTLCTRLQDKYSLPVEVAEPRREGGNVVTWKLRMITHPGSTSLPAQRIHIDICSIPSHDRKPMMLRNHYSVDMGTSGLILQAESREEIFADKILALALRPNRMKNRDLWDLVWLRQQGIELSRTLVLQKLEDRNYAPALFFALLGQRVDALLHEPGLRDDFVREMQRFLPVSLFRESVAKKEFWEYLIGEISTEYQEMKSCKGRNVFFEG